MRLAEQATARPWVTLCLLSLLVGFAFQGSRGLFDTTEGRYAEVAREMAERGAWLEPTLAYRPHWTKPPAAYWAIAGGFALFGRSAWGARFANAVAFCLTALAVAAIGATLWDRTTGYLAGLVYLSSPWPVAGAAVLSTDTLLTLWEVLAILGYAVAYRSAAPQRVRWGVWGMWVALGLGFFTKGPPALLPLAAIVVFHWIDGRRFRLADPLGIAAFAVVGGWWYVAVAARNPGLLGYFLGDELVGRALTDRFGRNPEWWAPFTLYLPVLLFGPGLWLLVAPSIIRHERLWHPRRLWRAVRAATPGGLLLLWLALPLLVLSLARSRLPLYVLPLYAPIALALARGMVRALPRGELLPRATGIALVSVALIVGLKAAAAYAYPSWHDMKRLAASARAVGGPAASYRIFEEEKLYGLQFYLDGAVERVARRPEPWADRTLQAEIERMSVSHLPYVFVSSQRHTPELTGALGAAGLPHTVYRVPRLRLIRVGRGLTPAVRDLFPIPPCSTIPATVCPPNAFRR
ncbi:MAG: ArnT family glycosyltransferase [Longimicrobiaceae bacterium]